jgi:hypothetical protein
MPRAGARIIVGWLLGLACFAYLLAQPPTLNGADESFILYGAKRVLQGQAVYHDFFDFITPGSFYLYALSYALGGVSITSARVTTALLNALSAVCTYFLTLHVAAMGEAILAGLLVVVLCVPVWNMASHHWIATAFGLATAAVLLAPRWRHSARARPAAAGALAGFLVCSHQNRGVWLILWLAVAVPLLTVATHPDSGRWRRALRELWWTAAGGAAVCVPVLGYAVWRASLAEVVYATHTWVLTNYRNYNVGKFPWASYGAFWAGGLKYTSYWLMKATPALLAIEAVALVWALWRRGLRAQLDRLLVLLLALDAVAAITYFPDIVHIAFILPFVLVVLGGMIHRIRTAVVWEPTPAVRAGLRLAWAAAFVAVLAKGWMNTRLAWRESPVLFDTAFGRLAGSPLQAGTIHDLRAELHVDDAKPPHLFAYSTDAWIYLTLPADNPTQFALLRPVYNTPEQVQAAIDSLERDPQALVLLSMLANTPDDPFVVYLRSKWHEVAGAGPPIFVGTPVYRLYARDGAG